MYTYIKLKGCTHERRNEMTRLTIQAITTMGSCVYTEIKVGEDYTMNEVVREVKRLGYKMFRIVDTMKRFVAI